MIVSTRPLFSVSNPVARRDVADRWRTLELMTRGKAISSEPDCTIGTMMHYSTKGSIAHETPFPGFPFFPVLRSFALPKSN